MRLLRRRALFQRLDARQDGQAVPSFATRSLGPPMPLLGLFSSLTRPRRARA